MHSRVTERIKSNSMQFAARTPEGAEDGHDGGLEDEAG